jgi:tetratricopeptide (TPR) repeat protein
MPRMRPAYWYAGLLSLTIAAYLPLWNNGFVDFDDAIYITKNPRVLEGLTASNIGWAWTTFHGKYWQPVSWLSLQLDAHLFSTRPLAGGPVPSAAAFHGQNLFWHGLSTLLLFAVLRRLTEALWRSFLVAALFAVHPTHVESVAWAAERKDVLSVFFGILTLWAYVRYLERPGWKRYFLIMAAYALSLLSKPMLMTLPFALLLLDYWPLRRLWPPVGAWSETMPHHVETVFQHSARPGTLRGLILEKLPLFLMAAAISVLTIVARERTGAATPLSVIPLSTRFANATSAYGWYLASTFYPVNLAVLYPHPLDHWSVPSALAGAGALLGITLLALLQARRRPWLSTGWLWFAGSLVPVIGLTQGGVQAWADRFSYWPHIGLFLALVWGLGELVDRLSISAWTAGAFAGLLLVCLTCLTWRQAGSWQDAVTLWERALAVTKDNHRAHLALGDCYREQGALDRADAHMAEAVRLQPESQDYLFAHGSILLMLGRLDEAAERFREALRRDPGHVDAWHNLGIVRLNQGKWAASIRCFRRALDLRPDSHDTHAGMGLAFWRLGQRQEAVRTFRTALALDPKEALAWHGLGLVYLAEGDLKGAIEALSRALSCNSQLVKARADLGLALCRKGEWQRGLDHLSDAAEQQDRGERRLLELGGIVPTLDAIPDAVVFRCRLAFALDQVGDRQGAAQTYHAAFQRDPQWPRKFTARAWRLTTDPHRSRRDPRLAYELASQAIQAVDAPTASMLDALAAAQAALGWFPDAIQSARQALAKALASEETALADSIQGRLRLYEQGQPFAYPAEADDALPKDP